MFGRLRIGIIGTGKMAEVMARTLKKAKGAVPYAVASRSVDRAESFAGAYGFKVYYGSYEALVRDGKVDLVYIATPQSEHYQHILMALDAGKPVLCEKPLALNERQAKMLIDYAVDRGLLLCEAMWIRFQPFANTIRETIAEGHLGEIRSMTMNMGYAIADNRRVADPAFGGGALLELGVCPLHFASMIFGEEVSDIAALSVNNERNCDVQDMVTLRFADGRMAQFLATTLYPTDRTAVLYGTKGTMVVENIANFEALTVYDHMRKKVLSRKRPRQFTGYEYEIEACVKAVKAGRIECAEMPHRTTLKMLNIMDFIRKQIHVEYPADSEFEEISEEELTALALAAGGDDAGNARETAAESAPGIGEEDAPSFPTEEAAAAVRDSVFGEAEAQDMDILTGEQTDAAE